MGGQDVGLGREFGQLDTRKLGLDPKDPLYQVLENLNRLLRQTYNRLDALEGRRGTVPLGANIDLNEHLVKNSADPEDDGDLIPKGYAEDNFGPAAIAAALQIGGSAPLNVSALRGVLAQPQPASAPDFTSTTLIGDELDGALFVTDGILYRVDRTTDPPVAIAVAAIAVFLQSTHAGRPAAADYAFGTVLRETDRNVFYINHDSTGTHVWKYLGGTMVAALASQPSDLGVNDVGFPFVSTDAGLITEYSWDGTAWQTIGGYLQDGNFQVTEDILWNSGTGFAGVFRHNNSTDRAYDFPNANGAIDYSVLTLTASQLLVGGGTSLVGPLGTLGSTTTVLHGNAAGLPTFGPVALGSEVSGTLPIAQGGTNAVTAASARTQLGAAAAQSIAADTIPLAKITGGGADGSLTVTAEGTISGYVKPT